MVNWLNIAYQFLKSLPSVVLDSREILIKEQDKPHTKTMSYSTFGAQFDIKVTTTITPGSAPRKFNMIIFISDYE